MNDSSIIWAASIVFSHYILSHKDLFNSQKLLELGSGCGLFYFILFHKTIDLTANFSPKTEGITGMAAHLVGADVMLSDIGLAVGHLKANVDLN